MNNILDNKIVLKNKKVLLRVDLNVPINNGAVTESSRIEKILPTINFLLKREAKIIIISHIGRPKGKYIKEMSLEPISKKLSQLLKKEVFFNKTPINENTIKQINEASNTSLMMLENIRFYEGEERNDQKFCKQISSLGDIFVNDAFSCSHRSHASIDGITKYIPSYFGLQIIEEMNALKKITSDIKKPVTCIIGGSKISTKINVIKNLIKIFDKIIIVGGMANTILKFKGINIGKSIFEDNQEKIVEEIFKTSKEYNCTINYPMDVVVSEKFDGFGKNKELNEIKNNEMILDIGPKTLISIKEIIDKSNTILWNGPAGYFENPNFENGTKEISQMISQRTNKNDIFSVAGGGETVAAINKYSKINSYTFVSTAGGAFLEFLEGKTLPGIRALNSCQN